MNIFDMEEGNQLNVIRVKYAGLKKNYKVKVEFLLGTNTVGSIPTWTLICFIKCHASGIIKENTKMSSMSLIALSLHCNCSNVLLQSKLT